MFDVNNLKPRERGSGWQPERGGPSGSGKLRACPRWEGFFLIFNGNNPRTLTDLGGIRGVPGAVCVAW